MPSAAIYIFDQTGEAKCFAALPDSMLHAPAIWRALARKYLPSLHPSWLASQSCGEFQWSPAHKLSQSTIAELVDRSVDWPPFERRVFATTLYGVVVRGADLILYAVAIREFIRHHCLDNPQLLDEAAKLDALGRSVGAVSVLRAEWPAASFRPEVPIGVGWMISDAVENPWADVDGRAYNLNTDDEHRWLDRDGNVETREAEACDAPSC